ncbi:MAG: PEP-CTERM sorting domain-containing protein [Planctomycetota bacterium]
MFISFKADTVFPPPTDREYFLKLLYVPPGMDGAPAVGTQWQIPTNVPFSLQLPTFRAKWGDGGYRFAFTMSETVPEPGTALMLLLATVLALRRKKEAGD